MAGIKETLAGFLPAKRPGTLKAFREMVKPNSDYSEYQSKQVITSSRRTASK
jgi:hypothetical protein